MKKNLFIALCAVLLLNACTAPVPKSTEIINSAEQTPQTSKIIIMVPENENDYMDKMTQFSQIGGENPLDSTNFVKKEIEIPYTTDLIKASAQAAAQEIEPKGGPQKANVSYFKTENNTAYVLMDIDLDGWAGVSVSLAIIHPIIEKTLLQFPEIQKVIFDYAPKDK